MNEMNKEMTKRNGWRPWTALILGAVFVSIVSIGLWETISGDNARGAMLKDQAAIAQEKTNKILQEISAKQDKLIALFKDGKAKVIVTEDPKKKAVISGSRGNVRR